VCACLYICCISDGTFIVLSNLSKYQKGVYYSGIKIFNNLPPNVKNLSHNIKMFKTALKEYLLSHSYSVEEFTLAKNTQLT
jgi:hypothetical protein